MNQQCKAGREWEHYQSEDPNPTKKLWNKEKIKHKTKRKSKLEEQEEIGSALKTRQSHTIKHMVNMIVS